MTTVLDIQNSALAEAGTRTTLTTVGQVGPAGTVCALFYNRLRQMLLRTAHWGFARRTLAGVAIGSAFNTPPNSIQPWNFEYAYPADCLKVRYVFPPPVPPPAATVAPVVGVAVAPWPYCGPSRKHRFLVSTDVSSGIPVKVLLSNVQNANIVYTADVTDPDQWDSLFQEAMVMGLANKIVIPLSGNVKLKDSYAKLAMEAILQARVADGNEAIPTTDHVPDFIKVRGGRHYPDHSGLGDYSGEEAGGSWWGGYDDINWGM